MRSSGANEFLLLMEIPQYLISAKTRQTSLFEIYHKPKQFAELLRPYINIAWANDTLQDFIPAL